MHRREKHYRLARPYKLFANEREIIDEAYPGDVLGLPNTGDFAIGDTLCDGETFQLVPIPRFQPEYFALLRNKDMGKQKQFLKGLRQLEMEGAVQVLSTLMPSSVNRFWQLSGSCSLMWFRHGWRVNTTFQQPWSAS